MVIKAMGQDDQRYVYRGLQKNEGGSGLYHYQLNLLEEGEPMKEY